MPESYEPEIDEEFEWTSLGAAVAPVMVRVFEKMIERQLEDLERLNKEAA